VEAGLGDGVLGDLHQRARQADQLWTVHAANDTSLLMYQD
jgi:hypothetical protein